jgi:hypothetical protein
MDRILASALLGFLLASSATAADGGAAAAPAATPPAVATPATAAKVAFGIITVSADHHSLTMPDGKGGTLTLAITDKTTITADLKKADLASLAADRSVRVTYTGDTADAIDQLSPEKKKKKKKNP